MSGEVKAIILAAGEGTRLRPFTFNRPKCLVEFAGIPLLAHQVDVLKEVGISDINVVTGYLANEVEDLGYKTIYNADYMSTNMVESLMCAVDLLNGESDVLIIYGDIIYEAEIVRTLLECQLPISTTIDKSWQRLWQVRSGNPLSDAETLKLDDSMNILEIGKKPKALEEIEGQYMGLIKVSAQYAPQFVASYQKLDPNGLYDGRNLRNMFMTSFLQYLIDSGQAVRAVIVSGGWLEFDTVEDLEVFNKLHEEGSLPDYCRILR